MNNTTTQTTNETRQVEVTLNGETRTITVERHSPQHCWFTTAKVVCMFRTGTKRHTAWRPQVVNRDGRWSFPTQVVHNRHVRVVAWADQAPGNSGWTG